MPTTKTYTVYTYDELPNDRAQERARDWYRNATANDMSDIAECVVDDTCEVAAILGIAIATRPVRLMGGGTGHKPEIYYSVSACQGDGACFQGRYRFAPKACSRIRQHAPQDTDLHAIADTLRDLQRPYFYSLIADVRHTGRYYHEHSVTIHVDSDLRSPDGDTCEAIAEELRDFMRWIYRRLEREFEYQLSDEVIIESIRANEYTFDEHGNRED